MLANLASFGRLILGTLKDLTPIILVVAFFQLAVLRQPFPDLGEVLGGLVLVTLGLALFVQGLEMGLFPLGQSMADAFARKSVLAWLLTFAFALGFGTTVAEPALIAVAGEAAEAAAEAGVVAADEDAMDRYATGLRYTVALSVGIALILGVIRILKGWPIQHFIVGGYLLVVLLTPFAPKEIVGVAYDSGGVTTSTVTVPLVTALGVGIGQRDPRPHPLDRRFRPDRLRQPHPHHLRPRLRHADLRRHGLAGLPAAQPARHDPRCRAHPGHPAGLPSAGPTAAASPSPARHAGVPLCL